MTRAVRDVVLGAAADVLAEGAGALRVRDVVARAGVSSATVYRLFESKDALLQAVARWHFARVAAEERRMLERTAAEVGRGVESLVTMRVASARAHATLLGSLRGHEATQWIASPTGALEDPGTETLTTLFRDAVRPPGLSARDVAELCAVALRGVLSGALEERPQYLASAGFARELSDLVRHLALRDPGPFGRATAPDHTHRFHDARPTANARVTPTQARSRSLVEAVLGAVERLARRPATADYSTPAIAEVAGVSVGSLYRYFPNRDAVLRAVIDRWIDHDLALVTRWSHELDPLPFPEKLAAGVGFVWDRHVEHRAIYELLFPLVRRLERYGAAQDFLERATRVVIGHARAKGEDRDRDLELALFVLRHGLIGLSRSAVLARETWLRSPTVRALLARWAGALAERRPARATI